MPDGDDASLREWLRAWGDCVARADFSAARPLFDPSVTGFGTYAGAVAGLDRLEAEQWRHVWPSISGFRFDADGAQLLVSGDGTLAVIVTTWTSIGPEGTDRPGRATIVVRRAGVASPWRGVHTHFSLVPA